MEDNINDEFDIDFEQPKKKSMKRLKSKVISKHIGKKENTLTFPDVSDLIKTLNFESKINIDEAKKLFEEIDKENTGKIDKTEFLDRLENDYNFTPMYDELCSLFKTKSEIILEKLAEIALLMNKNGMRDAEKEIVWIIHTISHCDIYEAEVNIYNAKHDFLTMMPQIESNISRLKDYESFRRSAVKRRKTTINTKCKNSLKEFEIKPEIFDSVSGNIKRKELEKIDNPSFNIFEIDSNNTMILKDITKEIFQRTDLTSLIDESKMNFFFKEVVSGYYRTNSYHNDIHAADVLQTVFVMLQKGKLDIKLNLEDVDVLSLLLAAIMHDFKHPGLNNNYLVNSRSEISITYNDSSVLESMHCAETFKLLSRKECNILEKLPVEAYRIVRRRVIECILATDNAFHSKHLSQLKNIIDNHVIKDENGLTALFEDDNVKLFNNQQTFLNMIIHAADISNPAKPLDLYKKWVDLVFDEFFSQGDLEKTKDLPISFNCDRDSVQISKAQIGFITLIVKPTFEVLNLVIPECNEYLKNIAMNLKYYEEHDKDKRMRNSLK